MYDVTTSNTTPPNSSPSPYSPDTIYPSKHGYKPYAFNTSLTPSSTVSTVDHGYNASKGILAQPLHAWVCAENYWRGEKNKDDAVRLSGTFPMLYDYHGHIFDYRLGDGEAEPFTIIHPFESTIPLNNPFWSHALKEVIEDMNEKGWVPDPKVPDDVKGMDEFPDDEDVYNAALYMLSCMSGPDVDYDVDKYIESCNVGWRMMDVGWLGILGRSGVALREIEVIGKENNIEMGGKGVEDVMDSWLSLTTSLINSLYDPSTSSFRSKVITNKGTTTADVGVASDFYALAGWYSGVRGSSYYIEDGKVDKGMRDGMVMKLLNDGDLTEGSFR
eukprot:CAMPEP_0118652202 /NCGR_PEP_ID=MMETSP0785-20121206/11191_1 /TAXON_ID=91992 /ORGANISM="Bolidomonas pacifica, Strain CCMP 1866" /LENGTH=329 /DNA_ID=CAMNT_0006544701 /DNA_START=399 /DNA_END=1385 /DNA_ORIENTATION=-